MKTTNNEYKEIIKLKIMIKILNIFLCIFFVDKNIKNAQNNIGIELYNNKYFKAKIFLSSPKKIPRSSIIIESNNIFEYIMVIAFIIRYK